ncbi:MAG: UDP-N-acetylglucosamine 2-epimerase (non-hydrolyzing) [Legionellaceae bacterium]|nr:UDP-N-acetylglucosamine 2-epimerase (non-hydrolyzing) [Legionellaceae bacterium]
MLKVITVIGARPQFIKAGMVSAAIDKWSKSHTDKSIEEIIVHTGQHYDKNMSDIFFDELTLHNPKYNLAVGSNSHASMTANMMLALEPVFLRECPNVILVYGDTNSTLAASMVAAKLKIPIAHVEAGLRSYNLDMPEEINRIVTDKVSQVLFCPTKVAEKNLLEQKKYLHPRAKIWFTGDVMLDSLLFYQSKASPSKYLASIFERTVGEFYLLTLHRPVNVDSCKALSDILKALVEGLEDKKIIFPVHPRTKDKLPVLPPEVVCINPVGYMDMLVLLKRCSGVFTDSGGLQKEAYFSQKPCVVLRQETEWLELVDVDCAFLAGADPEKIRQGVAWVNKGDFDFSAKLYGDGCASNKIVEALVCEFGS